MKLLFISQAARVIFDDHGNAYLNNHMNRKTIQRYRSHCDEMVMFLRDSGIRMTVFEANEEYNPFPYDLTGLIVGFNPYSPLYNLINIRKRREFEKKMASAILAADRVIIAAASGVYADTAIRYCDRYRKKYMLLNGGFAFEAIWNNKNVLGKMAAPIEEFHCKKNLRKAPYALYVTEYSLQKRYPCKGESIGVSDVEVEELSPEVLTHRIEKIIKKDRKFILGTAAAIDNPLKGQKYVIRAMAKMKKAGFSNLEYQLLGAGNPDKLLIEAKKCGVSDQVKILGSKPHSEVYDWIDSIDVYIQPSFSEGLCRAVVEAMSRGCPVLCSTAGGNVELCEKEFSFKAGNIKQIVDCIMRISRESEMLSSARCGFEKAKRYEKSQLDTLRDTFLNEFMK